MPRGLSLPAQRGYLCAPQWGPRRCISVQDVPPPTTRWRGKGFAGQRCEQAGAVCWRVDANLLRMARVRVARLDDYVGTTRGNTQGREGPGPSDAEGRRPKLSPGVHRTLPRTACGRDAPRVRLLRESCGTAGVQDRQLRGTSRPEIIPSRVRLGCESAPRSHRCNDVTPVGAPLGSGHGGRLGHFLWQSAGAVQRVCLIP